MSTRSRAARRSHPLLLYRRLASYYGTPSVWLLLVSVILLIWDHPSLKDLQLALVLAALLSVTLILLTFVMSRLARVECGEDGLLIQVPLYRVHVPYDSIVRTRTASLGSLFPRKKQPFFARSFLNPLWQRPAVVVEVELLPLPSRQLRLWMDARMFLKSAMVLLVEDSRGLRTQIDDAMIRWRVAKRGP